MMKEEFVLSDKYNVLMVVITTIWITSMFTIGWIGGIVGFIILCFMTGHRESLINKKAIEERQQKVTEEQLEEQLAEEQLGMEKETLVSIHERGQVLIEQMKKVVDDSMSVYVQVWDYKSNFKRREVLTPLKLGLTKLITNLKEMKQQYEQINYSLVTLQTDDEELLLLWAKFSHDLREIKQLLDKAEDLWYSIKEIGA